MLFYQHLLLPKSKFSLFSCFPTIENFNDQYLLATSSNITNLVYEDSVNSGNDIRSFIVMKIKILRHLMTCEQIAVLNDN